MSDAKDSGERGAVGPKTHITLKSAIIIMAALVTPLTVFIVKMSDDVSEIKKWMTETEARITKTTDDHEARIRILEQRK